MELSAAFSEMRGKITNPRPLEDLWSNNKDLGLMLQEQIKNNNEVSHRGRGICL
jgi:hypothetical protein